jgi:hypothetical protein
MRKVSVTFPLFILLLRIIWDTKAVIGWRQKYSGLKPASHYYGLAQEKILEGGTNSVKFALECLKRAFSWDSAYVQKAQKDPLFANLREYEQFKILIEEYNSPHSET